MKAIVDVVLAHCLAWEPWQHYEVALSVLNDAIENGHIVLPPHCSVWDVQGALYARLLAPWN